MNYLLDTNIVLTYLRDNEQAKKLEEDLRLLSGGHNLIISVVTVGEIKSIAEQTQWGERRLERMERMLSRFLVIDLNNAELLERYATIDAYSQGKLRSKPVNFSARNMGKNDLWIAATASAMRIRLLTSDKDFSHLDREFLDLQSIDLQNYK